MNFRLREPGSTSDLSGKQLAIVIKTNEGAQWILPQVREALRRQAKVLVIIPAGEGRLARQLDNLALDEPSLRIQPIDYDFSFRPNFATFRGLVALRSALLGHHANAVLYHLYASALAVRISTIGLRRVSKTHMVAGPLYLENKLIRRIERIIWRFDDYIVAGSDYTKIQYGKLGVPEARLESVPYGVNTEYFDPAQTVTQTSARNQLGLREDMFVIVLVAYVYAPKSLVFPGVGIKGHEIALAAWQRFSAGKNNVALVFLGSGFGEDGESHRQVLKRRFEAAGDTGRVLWLETVDDVRTIYAAADLSISPSLSDNHGAVLEASAMSLPSVVSDAGALREAVTDDTGWVFPSGDDGALTELLESAYNEWLQGTLQARGVHARRFMQRNFELRDCAVRVVDIALSWKGQ